MNDTAVIAPLLVLGFVLLLLVAACLLAGLIGWMMCRAIDRYTMQHVPVSDRELWQDQIDTDQRDD